MKQSMQRLLKSHLIKKASYDKLLDVFWGNHDPTQLNRQSTDVGIQYRSAIFYHNDAQKKSAEKSKEAVFKKLKVRIATKSFLLLNSTKRKSIISSI